MGKRKSGIPGWSLPVVRDYSVPSATGKLR
jgi:hypothetical protein